MVLFHGKKVGKRSFLSKRGLNFIFVTAGHPALDLVHQLIFIKPLPGAWVSELLGLGVQDHKKIKFSKRVYSSEAVKGLRKSQKKLMKYFLELFRQREEMFDF